MLFLNATHKHNNLKPPLFVMLVEDGNGESCVAGLFVSKGVGRDTIKEMINMFKVNNPKWKTLEA